MTPALDRDGGRMRQTGLIGVALLGACVAHPREQARALRPFELATSTYEEAVTASVTGSLMYEDGCLLFRDDGTNEHVLPIWPSGSVFNGTSVIFHHPGKADQPILISQELVIEGVPEQWASLPASDHAAFRRQCAAPPFFVSRVRPAD